MISEEVPLAFKLIIMAIFIAISGKAILLISDIMETTEKDP